MRLADATALRIGGKNAIEAKLAGTIVWSGNKLEAVLAILYGNAEQGTFYPLKPDSLYVDQARTIRPVHGDPVWWADDLSGNGMHAEASDSASRPTYGTDGTNHWLYFNGSQHLNMPHLYLTDQPAMTRFIAHRADSTASIGYALGAGNAGPSIILGGIRVSSDLRARGRRISSDDMLRFILPNFTANNVSTYQADYQAGTAFARNNGGQTVGQTFSSTGLLGSQEYSLLGSFGADQQYGYTGRIYGVADVASIVTSADIQEVENYLGGLMP
jgi:hypothetical protein